MKISVAQLNFHVGNLEYNRGLIIDSVRKAKKEGSSLVVFPEMAITGYPPLDLLDNHSFVEECMRSVEIIAAECQGISALVGGPSFNMGKTGKKLFNSAFYLSSGRIQSVINKALLPTYDIFDEYRYFEPGNEFNIIRIEKVRIAVTICEDLWDEQPFDNRHEKSRMYSVSPMEELNRFEPDLIINMSASPFSYSRLSIREALFTSKAAKYRLPLIMSNQTGTNTDVVFDGSSIVIKPGGRIHDRLNSFTEDFRTYSISEILSEEPRSFEPFPSRSEMIIKALESGIKDYFGKMGFSKAIIGLSGGIDSALVAALAARSLGPGNVLGLLMPSRYSSDHSVKDAVELSVNLGIKYEIVSIEESLKSFEKTMSESFREEVRGITHENIQSRIRAIILMAYSNKEGYILLNTSNKSESATGYGTLYGDMAGGLSVIGDVYKTDVYNLCRCLNETKSIIPENIITKPPSAELKPDQKDSDSLPPYEILDTILYQYIELQKSKEEIVNSGFAIKDVEWIISLVNKAEYKRFQSPPVIRISSKSFGPGRRMPLVAKY